MVLNNLQVDKSIHSNFSFEYLSDAKRIKRTSSPITTNLYINSSDENSEFDEEEDYDEDERDSTTVITCPICNSTYHRLGHLLRHAKRKHQIDLSDSNLSKTLTEQPINSNELQSKSKFLISHSNEIFLS